MKSNEKGQSLLLNYKCKYNHFVMSYYNAAYSVHFFRQFDLYKNMSYPFILAGDLKRKGTKFMLRRPDLGILMFYEILESTITDYYSRFKFLIYKTNPETFRYIHLVEVRYINEDQCDIRSSLIYDNKIFLSEKEFQETLRLKYMIYKQIEISLSKYYMQKLAIVYTIFNNKIELIWNILLNMKLLHKYTFIFADKINYKGNFLKKNDIIELIENNKNYCPIKCIAKVKKCKISSMDLTKEGIIELLFKDYEINNLPKKKTKIYLRIYEYEGKCTMYILYYFLNNQSFEFLGNFTYKKIKELETLKNIIEKYIIYNANNSEKIK
jgi:hypothetical protein